VKVFNFNGSLQDLPGRRHITPEEICFDPIITDDMILESHVKHDARIYGAEDNSGPRMLNNPGEKGAKRHCGRGMF
jgi:hypothetical protein